MMITSRMMQMKLMRMKLMQMRMKPILLLLMMTSRIVNAGVDMILMPQDYETAYNGLLQAVQDGTITEERIDESVERIVKVKLQMQ